MAISLEFKPQDLWIGAYWKNNDYILHVWICIIPMFPIHVKWLKV